MTNDKHKADDKGTASLAGRLLLLAIGMFGFGFLLVPLYDAFCEITGFGGRTNETPVVVEERPDASRDIDLEFVTTVNEYAPWTFSSDLPRMTVHPGGLYEATFTAMNLTDRHKVAQAVPSVAPQEAARYFKKLECFCFTTQEFAAGESKSMPVRFVIDSDMPEHIDTITLSYTFFDTARLSKNSNDAPHPTHETARTSATH
jgi:cytochrome c oxidase assembly protein subunit 11